MIKFRGGSDGSADSFSLQSLCSLLVAFFPLLPTDTSNCKSIHQTNVTTACETSHSPCFADAILSHKESDLSTDRLVAEPGMMANKPDFHCFTHR